MVVHIEYGQTVTQKIYFYQGSVHVFYTYCKNAKFEWSEILNTVKFNYPH